VWRGQIKRRIFNYQKGFWHNALRSDNSMKSDSHCRRTS
jgi:hypothetical protein